MFGIFDELKYFLKVLVGKLIEEIDAYESRNAVMINDKFVESEDIDIMVKSDDGFVHASKLYKTKLYQVYRIEFSDGSFIECADNHLIFKDLCSCVYAKDIAVGDAVCGDGLDKVVSKVIKYPFKMCMYDMTVDSDKHAYYTNGVLSHNTTTTAAYITWYICFHTDRNVGIMANKEDTAKEIVDKTQEMIKGLPFFLQPGVRKWGAKGAKFDNGCAIISSATTKTASIGFTMNGILYLDEFAHIDQNICYDFWRSVYPTLSSSKTAQLIISSTPNGTDHNKFYDLWSGDNNDLVKKIRVDYWQVPGHDDAWAEEQKKIFGEEEFNQEFLLQFSASSKALLKGRSLAFIENVCKKLGNYKVNEAMPLEKYLDDDRLMWVKGFNPNAINPRDRFVIIIDLSDGKGDEDEIKKFSDKSPDSNTIQIYKLVMNSPQNIMRYKGDGKLSIGDAYRYVQVGRWESNEKDEQYCGNLAAAIALDLFESEKYDNTRIMLEMNFNGKSCLNQIQNNPRFYDNLVLKTYHTKPTPGEKTATKKHFGFKTGSEKEYYCKVGAKMFAKKRIIVTDMQTYNQLKSFGYNKGTIKGIACHDDLSYPALNHIPRMLDESYFMDWLQEAFEMEENTKEKYEVNKLLELYEMDDTNLGSSDLKSFYGNNGFGGISTPTSYGGIFGNNGNGSIGGLMKNRY